MLQNKMVVYEPRALSEFIDNKECVDFVVKQAHNALKTGAQHILAYGPSGVGKSLLPKLVAKELDYQLIEISSVTVNEKSSIERILKSIRTTQSLFNKPFIVLFDDLESLLLLESGISSVIIDFLKSKGNFLAYLVADDIYDRRLSHIKLYCTPLQFRKVSCLEIKKYLKKVSAQASIKISDSEIDIIAEQCDGDVRAAINDLRALNFTGSRDMKKNVFDALKLIFKTKDIKELQLISPNLDIDFDLFRLWLYENIPLEYIKVNELVYAYNYLSRSDLFSNRIIKRQNWKLLRYVYDLAILGVAFAKKEVQRKFVKYSFPSILNKMSKSRELRNVKLKILEKIATKTHTSTKSIMKEFPLYIEMLKLSQEQFLSYYSIPQTDVNTFLNGNNFINSEKSSINGSLKKQKAQ